MNEEDEAFNEMEKRSLWRKRAVQAAISIKPPQRTWVGLDEVEIVGLTCECIDVGEFNMNCAIDFARQIEAKLKERNS